MKLKNLTRWIDLQKEGIIIGAIVGAILYYINPPFLSILNLSGLWWHNLAVLILISSTIGAIIDSKYKPRK